MVPGAAQAHDDFGSKCIVRSTRMAGCGIIRMATEWGGRRRGSPMTRYGRALRMIAFMSFGAAALPLTAAPMPAELEAATQRTIDRGLTFLEKSQRPDGGWLGDERSDPAISALIITAFMHDADYGPRHPVVERGLAFMMRFVQRDGGIYVEGEALKNYQTSVCLAALSAWKSLQPSMAEADQTGRYDSAIKAAQDFLKNLQWDEHEEHDRDSSWYGGAGYGRGKRPDLSNTQMMVEALHESGLSKDDPAYQKAVQFISRCQNLDETNDQPFARGVRDGGFIYSCANDGESKAGTDLIEGRPHLRSYGSMTYAGFKSLLYAGVARDDERVKTCVEWIKRHYTLDANPNMPHSQSKEGLYYYYHVFAKALYAWGETLIADSRGEVHNWRVDLCAKLNSLQLDDGSWVNTYDRWMEGNPQLVTAYSLRALQTALSR